MEPSQEGAAGSGSAHPSVPADAAPATPDAMAAYIAAAAAQRAQALTRVEMDAAVAMAKEMCEVLMRCDAPGDRREAWRVLKRKADAVELDECTLYSQPPSRRHAPGGVVGGDGVAVDPSGTGHVDTDLMGTIPSMVSETFTLTELTGGDVEDSTVGHADHSTPRPGGGRGRGVAAGEPAVLKHGVAVSPLQPGRGTGSPSASPGGLLLRSTALPVSTPGIEVGGHATAHSQAVLPKVLACGMRVGRVVGRGSAGIVYKAMDTGGTIFAVKVVALRRAADAAAVAQEYNVLKMLSHRNIVKVWDFFCTESTCEIVMSYFPQGSLQQQISDFGGLSEASIRRYGLQILEGLAYLHSNAVVHGDIKPLNMLVDAAGRVALADFGLCLIPTSAQHANERHAAGGAPRGGAGGVGPDAVHPRGTLHYMSKSVAFGYRLSRNSDLWAVGCALLEMANALLPWKRRIESLAQLTYTYRAHPEVTPLTVADEKTQHEQPQLSEHLRSLVASCFVNERELSGPAAAAAAAGGSAGGGGRTHTSSPNGPAVDETPAARFGNKLKPLAIPGTPPTPLSPREPACPSITGDAVRQGTPAADRTAAWNAARRRVSQSSGDAAAAPSPRAATATTSPSARRRPGPPKPPSGALPQLPPFGVLPMTCAQLLQHPFYCSAGPVATPGSTTSVATTVAHGGAVGGTVTTWGGRSSTSSPAASPHAGAAPIVTLHPAAPASAADTSDPMSLGALVTPRAVGGAAVDDGEDAATGMPRGSAAVRGPHPLITVHTAAVHSGEVTLYYADAIAERCGGLTAEALVGLGTAVDRAAPYVQGCPITPLPPVAIQATQVASRRTSWRSAATTAGGDPAADTFPMDTPGNLTLGDHAHGAHMLAQAAPAPQQQQHDHHHTHHPSLSPSVPTGGGGSSWPGSDEAILGCGDATAAAAAVLAAPAVFSSVSERVGAGYHRKLRPSYTLLARLKRADASGARGPLLPGVPNCQLREGLDAVAYDDIVFRVSADEIEATYRAEKTARVAVDKYEDRRYGTPPRQQQQQQQQQSPQDTNGHATSPAGKTPSSGLRARARPPPMGGAAPRHAAAWCDVGADASAASTATTSPCGSPDRVVRRRASTADRRWTAHEVYGDGVFEITGREIAWLRDSTHLTTTEDFDRRFFLSLLCLVRRQAVESNGADASSARIAFLARHCNSLWSPIHVQNTPCHTAMKHRMRFQRELSTGPGLSRHNSHLTFNVDYVNDSGDPWRQARNGGAGDVAAWARAGHVFWCAFQSLPLAQMSDTAGVMEGRLEKIVEAAGHLVYTVDGPEGEGGDRTVGQSPAKPATPPPPPPPNGYERAAEGSTAPDIAGGAMRARPQAQPHRPRPQEAWGTQHAGERMGDRNEAGAHVPIEDDPAASIATIACDTGGVPEGDHVNAMDAGGGGGNGDDDGEADDEDLIEAVEVLSISDVGDAGAGAGAAPPCDAGGPARGGPADERARGGEKGEEEHGQAGPNADADHEEASALYRGMITSWAGRAYRALHTHYADLRWGVLQWVRDVQAASAEYGFHSPAAAKGALLQSAAELCGSVCLSQRGYYFTSSWWDPQARQHVRCQLIPKTSAPVTFLHATGLDFTTPGVKGVELRKYFRRVGEAEPFRTPISSTQDLEGSLRYPLSFLERGRSASSDDDAAAAASDGDDDARCGTPTGIEYAGFLPLGDKRLRQRLTDIYRAVYANAQHHRVQHLCLVPLNAGADVPALGQTDRSAVDRIEYSVMFRLLCDEDWGFHCVYLCFGEERTSAAIAQRRTAVSVLEQLLSVCTHAPRCHIVFHACDTNALAVELARRRRAAGVLCRTTAWSLLLGTAGGAWEQGRYMQYSDEEHAAAHSTACLMHSNVMRA